jgi:hypothetical protein
MPSSNWPKEIIICLECGATSNGKTGFGGLCNGDAVHGPTQKVSVVLEHDEPTVARLRHLTSKLQEEVARLNARADEIEAEENSAVCEVGVLEVAEMEMCRERADRLKQILSEAQGDQ